MQEEQEHGNSKIVVIPEKYTRVVSRMWASGTQINERMPFADANQAFHAEMYGDLESVAAAPAKALSSNSSIVGFGLCPEAIEQNPVVYAIMNEWPFRCACPAPADRLHHSWCKRHCDATIRKGTQWHRWNITKLGR